MPDPGSMERVEMMAAKACRAIPGMNHSGEPYRLDVQQTISLFQAAGVPELLEEVERAHRALDNAGAPRRNGPGIPCTLAGRVGLLLSEPQFRELEVERLREIAADAVASIANAANDHEGCDYCRADATQLGDRLAALAPEKAG